MENGEASKTDWPGRWAHVLKVLERPGPLATPNFDPGPENLDALKMCKVLIVGAGGLGCELLKNLGLSGFQNLHVIDMDTVDISNLNRQFLFRMKDVGRSKAEAASEFIHKRIPGCNVTPYFCKIQEKDSEFYRSFNIVICGLDSIVARRWINAMILSLLDYNEDGSPDPSTLIPIIDGGTEGFKGNARVILPGFSPCIECTLSLFPPQVNFPMCTIAHTPRLPEHCIEYARAILWEKEKPFDGASLDGDNPEHIQWILERSLVRADEFGIKGVNYRLTQGVVKHIIPAVASTNAVIAAACVLETFKLATNCAAYLNNYLNFQDVEGIYVGAVQMDKREDCPVCSQIPQKFTFKEDAKLQDMIDFLVNSTDYQMKSPAITVSHPSFKTLYMGNIPNLEEQTRPNLRKSLKDLGLEDGQEVYVADQTTINPLTFKLELTSLMEH